LHHLAELALVASLDIPFYVAVEQWPPEVVSDGVPRRVEALVAKAVMGVVNDGEAEWKHNV
jgi:hypothetical protein